MKLDTQLNRLWGEPLELVVDSRLAYLGTPNDLTRCKLLVHRTLEGTPEQALRALAAALRVLQGETLFGMREVRAAVDSLNEICENTRLSHTRYANILKERLERSVEPREIEVGCWVNCIWDTRGGSRKSVDAYVKRLIPITKTKPMRAEICYETSSRLGRTMKRGIRAVSSMSRIPPPCNPAEPGTSGSIASVVDLLREALADKEEV